MRKAVHVLFTLLLLISCITPVLADEVEDALQPLTDKLDVVFKAGQVLVLSVSSLVLIYAGYLHMVAEGSPENELKARKCFKGAILGIALVMLAEVIKQVIVNLLS